MGAWTNALSLAHDDIEREGVYIHFARIQVQAGRFDDARKNLDAVTNSMYAEMKRRVSRTLYEKEHPEETTNNVPPAVDIAPPPTTNSAPRVP